MAGVDSSQPNRSPGQKSLENDPLEMTLPNELAGNDSCSNEINDGGKGADGDADDDEEVSALKWRAV